MAVQDSQRILSMTVLDSQQLLQMTVLGQSGTVLTVLLQKWLSRTVRRVLTVRVNAPDSQELS